MKGEIKWYSTIKGFGFIQDNNEIDYFLHHTELNYGYTPINGSMVEFEPVETDKGWKAVNVKAISQDNL